MLILLLLSLAEIRAEPESPAGHSKDKVENDAAQWYPFPVYRAFPYLFFVMILITLGLVGFFLQVNMLPFAPHLLNIYIYPSHSLI